jgi:hypothetical protein
LKKELFPGLFTPAVEIRQGGLRRAGKHHGTAVSVFQQRPKQRVGKAEIALHELILRLRPVHPGEMIDELAFGAESFELPGRRIRIVEQDIAIPARAARRSGSCR